MPGRLRAKHIGLLGLSLVLVLLDQISKGVVVQTLRIYESIPVIPGFFNIVHVRNRGMAFGMMNRPDADMISWILSGVTVIAIVILVVWLFRLKEDETGMAWGLTCILGGAFGNLIDRVRYGEVVDFLDVYVGTYHWPAFNVADASITVGTFLVAFMLFFRRAPSGR